MALRYLRSNFEGGKLSDHSHGQQSHHIQGISYVSQALTITSPRADETLHESWHRIVVPPDIKDRLRNQALLAITLRTRGVPRISVPLHGLVVLSGSPGIGKTSLARGLASELSTVLGDRYGEVRLVDVNLHLLPSELLGRTQRNILQLFQEELPALAELGPMVVVLDELEVLALSRSQVSLDINPADVMRGTAALLSALDWVSLHLAGTVIVGTTNLPGALDGAMLSRSDLVLEVPMPSVAVIEHILADTLGEIAAHFPGGASWNGALAEVAKLLEGIDGRQARKFVVEALASTQETALDPSRLKPEELLALARQRRSLEV
jgi:pachytene checkpoint protein 2